MVPLWSGIISFGKAESPPTKSSEAWLPFHLALIYRAFLTELSVYLLLQQTHRSTGQVQILLTKKGGPAMAWQSIAGSKIKRGRGDFKQPIKQIFYSLQKLFSKLLVQFEGCLYSSMHSSTGGISSLGFIERLTSEVVFLSSQWGQGSNKPKLQFQSRIFSPRSDKKKRRKLVLVIICSRMQCLLLPYRCRVY